MRTRARGLLLRDVIPAVPAVRQRMTRAHHPGVQINPALMADRNQPPVTVSVPHRADHRLPSDPVSQCQRGTLTAAVCGAPRVGAGLTALGRIDAVQPEALAAYLKRVAINHRSRARNRARNRARSVFRVAMPGPGPAMTSPGVCASGMRVCRRHKGGYQAGGVVRLAPDTHHQKAECKEYGAATGGAAEMSEGISGMSGHAVTRSLGLC